MAGNLVPPDKPRVPSLHNEMTVMKLFDRFFLDLFATDLQEYASHAIVMVKSSIGVTMITKRITNQGSSHSAGIIDQNHG